MGNIYEAIAEQGKTSRGTLEYLEVPEWDVGGSPAKVYYRTGLSVDEWAAIFPHINILENGQADVTAEGILMMVRKLLRDENGALLFDGDAQFRKLRETADIRILLRILNQAELFKTFLQGASDPKKD